MQDLPNLEPLRNALNSLDTALKQIKDEFIRDSVIKRFEYTYELSWQAMQKYLQISVGREQVDHLPRRDLFRMAFEKGLIANVDAWFGYHINRNSTSHAYAEDIAEDVYQGAFNFSADARALHDELVRRGDD